MPETLLSSSEILLFGRVLEDIKFTHTTDTGHPGKGKGKGKNKFLGNQLDKDVKLARIYAFSYEGAFYELPSPAIFVVHGPGQSATEGNLPFGVSAPPPTGGTPDTRQAARAPLNPDTTGVAAADFQIANDIMFWPYDKADYSIRMDVLSGQLEQILLDVFFEVDLPMMAGAKVSGAKVAGAKVAGAKVAGAKVSGAKVAGAKVSGAKVGGFGD